MSMSTYVKGIRPPDDDWRRHKAVWDACVAAKVAMPSETEAYFNGEPPCEDGVVVDIEGATREYRGDAEDGIDVDLSKLPTGIKVIRFINSY